MVMVLDVQFAVAGGAITLRAIAKLHGWIRLIGHSADSAFTQGLPGAGQCFGLGPHVNGSLSKPSKECRAKENEIVGDRRYRDGLQRWSAIKKHEPQTDPGQQSNPPRLHGKDEIDEEAEFRKQSREGQHRAGIEKEIAGRGQWIEDGGSNRREISQQDVDVEPQHAPSLLKHRANEVEGHHMQNEEDDAVCRRKDEERQPPPVLAGLRQLGNEIPIVESLRREMQSNERKDLTGQNDLMQTRNGIPAEPALESIKRIHHGRLAAS